MSDKTYTIPDNHDPKFFRDVLIGLFAPSEYDNPEGRRILGEEFDKFDKAIEEVKKKIEESELNETTNEEAQD